MKKIFFNVYVWIIINAFLVSVKAQDYQLVKSVSIDGGYLHALEMQKDFISINGISGGAQIRFNLLNWINFDTKVIYSYSKVYQKNMIKNWNWVVYDTWYKDWKEQSSNGLEVSSTPNQLMHTMSVIFNVNLILPFNYSFVTPSLTLGVGPTFYWRRLWLEESWTRRFDNAPPATINFRNYASSQKKGTSFQYYLGIHFEFPIDPLFSIRVSGYFNSPFELKEDFPIKSSLYFMSGFVLYY